MAYDKLVISLLGPPELRVGNKVLNIKRKMFRYLVYYLACQPEPSSRESLCDLFWPDESEITSRKKLREVISKLRSELPVDDLIITQKEYVSLNKTRVEVDVRQFDDAIVLVRKNLNETVSGKIPEPVYITIQDALSLWRTSEFMGGVTTSGPASFQHWIFETGESLKYWRQLMYEWLADRCIIDGNYKEALNWLTMARQYDKLNTEINILILTCLRDLGLWSEAGHFCALLETDYSDGEEKRMPGALHDLIARVIEESGQPRFAVPKYWDNRQNTPETIIDRTEYLSEMTNVVNKGGVLLIQGESGSGKSVLLRLLRDRLDVLPLSLYFVANQGDEQVPFRALVECLRPVIPEEAYTALMPSDAQILAPLFPEIARARTDLELETILTIEPNERLVCDACIHLIKQIKPVKRSLLLIDNAQWLDSHSLRVFTYIQGNIHLKNIRAAILASRSDIANEHLEKFLAGYYPEQIVRTLFVEPLSEERISDYLRREFINVPSRSYYRQLLELSGGNIGYLTQMVELIKASKPDISSSIREPAEFLDGPIVETIERNLSSLDSKCRRLLGELSILGRFFNVKTIIQISSLSGNELRHALSTLCDHHFLKVEELPDGSIGYRFVHAIEAEYLRRGIDPFDRVNSSLKAARLIIATEGNGDERAARLAHLFQAAGEIHEAVRYWIQAGCFEKGLHHHDRAYEYFGIAQDLIRKLGDSADIEELFTLIKEWGDLSLEKNDLPTFISLCEDSQKYGESHGDQRLIGLAKSGYGWSSHFQRNNEIAEGFLLQAIEIFQKANDPINLMDSYTRLGIHYFINQDFVKAKSIFEKMPKMAILHQNSELMANYKKYAAYIVYVYCTVGNLNIARTIINEAKLLLVSSKELGTVIRTRIAETIVEYYYGNFDTVRQNAREILQQLKTNSLEWWEYALQIVNAQAALESGHINDCWAISEAICLLNNPMVDSEWGIRFSNYLRGEIFLHLGDLQKARAYFVRNQEYINDPFITMLTQFGLARVAIKREKSRDRGNIMTEVQQKASVHGFVNVAQMASIELLYLELEGMEGNSISKKFLKKTEILKTSEFPQIRIANLELLGRGYLKTGNEEKGKEYLQRALRAANEGQFFWNQFSILERLTQDGHRNTSQNKELRRLIEKEQITCEIPELVSALERFKNSWKV